MNLEHYSICNFPACLDSVMVECDSCGTRYHRSCSNAPLDILTKEEESNCGLCRVLKYNLQLISGLAIIYIYKKTFYHMNSKKKALEASVEKKRQCKLLTYSTSDFMIK